MHEFNQSLRYDKRMYAADIQGSIVYSKALTRVGILTQEEENKIIEGLKAVLKEWENGTVCLILTPLLNLPHCNDNGSLKLKQTTKIFTLPTNVD